MYGPKVYSKSYSRYDLHTQQKDNNNYRCDCTAADSLVRHENVNATRMINYTLNGEHILDRAC